MAFTRYKSEQNFDQISENRIVMLKKDRSLNGNGLFASDREQSAAA